MIVYVNQNNRIMDIPIKSVNSFCSGIIDYAGLFPPAKLDLKTAFENYIRYKNSNYCSILSRFIIPAGLLNELENLIDSLFANERNILLSVIPETGSAETSYYELLTNSLKAVRKFSIKFKESVNAEVFEIKIPAEVIKNHKESYTFEFSERVSDIVTQEISENSFIFLEGYLDGDWKSSLKKIINGINEHNLNKPNTGFKLRTGGVTPEMFPSSEQIAYSIKECIDRNVKMKCTAGLHHPFRHYDYELRTIMHGFINVFCAGLIAYRHNLSMNGMKEIINEIDGNKFVFSTDSFSWKDWKISIDEIELARNNIMLSFGSCSFDEPIADLKKLKLLL